jgi:hypothetical protein
VAKTPEKKLERNRAYYQANKEKIYEKRKLYFLEYRNAHREKQNAYNKKYREEHPKEDYERSQKWKAENPERTKELHKAWIKAHPEIVCTRDANRRARKAGAEGSYSTKEWKECLHLFYSRCAYCGKEDKRLTKDHVVPLINHGRHDANNIVPACRYCNGEKGTKSLLEFLIYRENKRKRQMLWETQG